MGGGREGERRKSTIKIGRGEEKSMRGREEGKEEIG